MKKTFYRFLGSSMAAVMLAGTLGQFPVSAAVENGWEEVDGKRYWYENGVKQGTEGRGKEIYDPGSDAWYWLDAVDEGKMAVSKDVYQESQADDAGNIGKWVRYDGEGHMVKGWDDTQAGTYYFDLIYGTMAKGSREIDGVSYFFNEETGILESGTRDGWASIDGKDYWYENGVRQGYDPNDPSYRGKEIYDPGSDAWYWLDNVQQGAKAVSKDVYQESQADDAGSIGKWVRYDAEGHMVKGWHEQDGNRYYFDPTYGTMAKGDVVIDGKTYRFDQNTGICQGEQGGNTEDNPGNEPGGDTPGTEEPGYDCGGATVRVNGGIWWDLGSDPQYSSYATAWEIASQIERKYNIKLEYAELDMDHHWVTEAAILDTIQKGECFADIFSIRNDGMLPLKDYLVDITGFADELKMGSIYLDAATWRGHTYGFTDGNIGNVRMLAYSRDYLKSIGMDVTPTQKFLAGEWSYEDAKEYFTELKSKLPEGTYPIAVHSNHWAEMAPAANGTVSVDSDGGIHLADDAYVEALDFYKELLELGLAAPVSNVEVEEYDGEEYINNLEMPFSLDGMSTATEGKGYVLAVAENWQMYDLKDKFGGEWGIVPFPWGSNVSCNGDYRTLSDTYRTAQSQWSNVVVPKAEYRAADAKEIPDNVLFQIAKDYDDLNRPEGAAARTAMYEAEKSGQPYENLGFRPGQQGDFSTMEDAGLYDWLHSRAVFDWGFELNEGVRVGVMVRTNAAFVIAAGRDAKATGEKYKAKGEAAMEEAGLLK